MSFREALMQWGDLECAHRLGADDGELWEQFWGTLLRAMEHAREIQSAGTLADVPIAEHKR